MRTIAPVLGCLVLVACGGVSEPADIFGDAAGGGNDASSKSDGGNTTDGSTISDSGTLPDGAPDCKALAAQLDVLRHKANSCTGGTPNVCGKIISDFCCSLTVTNPDSPDSKAFETARDNYKNLCGAPVCPGSPCPPAPSNTCSSTGQCG